MTTRMIVAIERGPLRPAQARDVTTQLLLPSLFWKGQHNIN